MNFVSLTFDDALAEHLDFVAPLLDEHKFRGTFYVHLSSPVLCDRAEEWRNLANAGHELGNHTIFHPAAEKKSWVTEATAIENYSLQRMKLELQTASDWLTVLDGKTERSFAYPCSNPVVGRPGVFRRMIAETRLERTRIASWLDRVSGPGDSRENYSSLAAEQFTACRCGGLTLDCEIPSLDQFDRALLPSVSIENHPLEKVQRFIERGLAKSTWPILQFHGVGGDHGQNCDPAVFRDLVGWLAEQKIKVETISSGIQSISAAAATDVDSSSGTDAVTSETTRQQQAAEQGSNV